MNYQIKNQELLRLCLNDLENWIDDSHILGYVSVALKKSINKNSINAIPPLLSILIAEDLEESKESLIFLFCACAYFYTAADLLDDIQDKDPHQPILQALSEQQAMNIVNLLLMGSYRCVDRLSISPQHQLTLNQMFTQMGLNMSVGQFWDIESTNNATFEHSSQKVATFKAGSELGCFLACVPCALGKPYKAYYQLGETIGLLLQTLSDYLDIWILPSPAAISEDLLSLKNSLPIQAARQDPKWGTEVNLALAGKQNTPQKQFTLRRLLAKTEAVEKFEALIQTVNSDLEKYASLLPPLKQVSALIDTYLSQANQLLAGLKKLRSITQYKSEEISINKNQGVNMALDYLEFIPDFRDTWEIQRWGFLEETPLYGDIFNPLLILETLKNFNGSTKTPFIKILKKASLHGWHYYSNTLKIPPDTDDLGLILQLAGDFPKTESNHFLKGPLKLLLKNLAPTGFCPTWLSDEVQYRREHIKAHWFGDECIAVMANLYYGLACYDQQAYKKQIERGTAYILAAYQPELAGWKSTHYKSRLYTLYLVSRLLRIQNTFFNFEAVLEKLLQNQYLDGSWSNSPQETAFALLFLKSLSNKDMQLKDVILKAETFLLDTQLYDGSWNGEDLFIRPGKNAVYEYFKHSKVTTAFCLRALI